MHSSLRLPVTHISEAGEARRRASLWAQELGLGQNLIATLALVVTELAKNLALHTRGGDLLLRRLTAGEETGAEILSLDRGPGVANFQACLRDGHSTAGTSGIGLGAVQRASAVFDVHSQPGLGTALLSQLWERSPKPAGVLLGVANVPFHGEVRCGDAWAVREVSGSRIRVIVADGLGHGDLAADASDRAIEIFHENSGRGLVDLMETIHGALRSTRGAAIAIADIDRGKGQFTYLGVGNIAGTIVQREKTTSLVSHNGTVGAQFRSMKEFTYPWPAEGLLVMQSDGVKAHWQLDRYAGLLTRQPGVIAGVIYRDQHRTTDDSTVVVLRPQT